MQNNVRGVKMLVRGTRDSRVWTRERNDFGADVGSAILVLDARAATNCPHVWRVIGVVVRWQVQDDLFAVTELCERVVVDVSQICGGRCAPSVNVETAISSMYFPCQKHVAKRKVGDVEGGGDAAVQKLTQVDVVQEIGRRRA